MKQSLNYDNYVSVIRFSFVFKEWIFWMW